MHQQSLKSLLQVVMGFGRTERRCEARLPAHGLASVRWDADGDERRQPVSLLGVSERGISFRSSQAFTVDQKIRVEPQENAYESFEVFDAVVRHAAQDGGDFIVGAVALAHLRPSEEESVAAGERER